MAPARICRKSIIFYVMALDGTLLNALPPASRPKLLRGTVHGQAVSLALSAPIRPVAGGLVRSRGFYLNERRFPFRFPDDRHNDILAAAELELVVRDKLVCWFASLRGEADELHVGGSQRRLPEAALGKWRLGCRETSLPSYPVDLCRLAGSDGEIYPVLSASARQQLRRAIPVFRTVRCVAPGRGGNRSGSINLFQCDEGAALRLLGAPRQAAFLHRRVLRAVPPAADRAQLSRGRNPASQGLRRRSRPRLLYNFRLGDRVYAYQSGFDDADRRERPGSPPIPGDPARVPIGPGVYDFMAGRNRLKESFSTRCEPMLWQTVQQPRLAFRLEDFARQFKRALTMRRSRGA